MADIPVHVEETINRFLLETLTTRRKGVDNHLSVALEMLAVRTIHKIVNSPRFISRLLDTIIDSPGFIALVAALVKSEQPKLATVQTKFRTRSSILRWTVSIWVWGNLKEDCTIWD